MKPETISLVANICTIFSSFSIVIAIFVYVKDKYNQNKRYNFSKKHKRSKYLRILLEKPSRIDKVVLSGTRGKGNSLIEVLLDRHRLSINGDREELLRNGLRFMLSKEAIKGFQSLNSEIYNNFDNIMSRFFELVVDRKSFYTDDSNKVDAWVELERINKFVVKFPIPISFYDEEAFSEVRFGNKTINSLGNEVVLNYFLPYLIFYVSLNYEKISKDDTYRIFSVLWEVGPS